MPTRLSIKAERIDTMLLARDLTTAERDIFLQSVISYPKDMTLPALKRLKKQAQARVRDALQYARDITCRVKAQQGVV